jgi:soluble lytic murein transglycosylase
MDRNYLKLIGIFSLMLVVLLVVVLPVRADIYRYIDENGIMHFTNTPTSSIQKFRIYLKEKPRVIQRYSSSEKYDNLILDASERHGVSFPLLKAIIKAESDFDPHVVSKKGAAGLMQIMPENFKPLGIRDPFDPWQNINAGARYFKQMYDRFKGRLALSLAAYNAGPSAVDYYKTIPPYEETEEYVRRVMKYYYNYKNL